MTISDSSPFWVGFWSLSVEISSSLSFRSDSSSSKRDFRLLNSETALKSQLPEKKIKINIDKMKNKYLVDWNFDEKSWFAEWNLWKIHIIIFSTHVFDTKVNENKRFSSIFLYGEENFVLVARRESFWQNEICPKWFWHFYHFSKEVSK